MRLCDERLSHGCTIKETIASVLCQAMPATAALSGLCTAINLTPAVARLHALYREEKIAEHFAMTADDPMSGRDFGLSALCDWLAAKGETISRSVVKAWREEMIVEAMRRNLAKGATPFIHLRR